MNIRDIVIDLEFENHLEPLTDGERRGLVASVLKDGFTDPIIVWLGRNILIDGHNRYRIWETELNGDEDRAPEIVERSYQSREEALLAVEDRQDSRRNSNTPKRILRMKAKYEVEIKAQAKGKQRGGRGGVLLKHQGSEATLTNEKIAEAAGTSIGTVKRFNVVMKDGTEDLKEQVLAGDVKIRTAYDIVKGKPAPDPSPSNGDAKHEKPKRTGVGLERAHEAIAKLRSIPARDPLRAAAFETVAKWIKVNKPAKETV